MERDAGHRSRRSPPPGSPGLATADARRPTGEATVRGDRTGGEPRLSRRSTLVAAGVGVTGLIGGVGFGVLASRGPVAIEDWHDLAAVATGDETVEYTLVADLDETSPGYAGIGDDWSPIGRSASDRFEGVFDGGGRVIEGLVVDRPETDGVGLFGHNGGTIERVGLVGAEVTGRERVGGVVGDNLDGVVRSASAVGTVRGTDAVGGLVGSNASSVRASYAGGAVAGTVAVGGLVGRNRAAGRVAVSYALGDVAGERDVGGLVGAQRSRRAVRGCYAVGVVDGGDAGRAGGLVGHSDGRVEHGYWAVDASGQPAAIGADAGTTSEVAGASTDALSGQAATDAMPGLDFIDDWAVVVEGASSDPTPTADGHPILRTVDARAQLDAQRVGYERIDAGGRGTFEIDGATPDDADG